MVPDTFSGPHLFALMRRTENNSSQARERMDSNLADAFVAVQKADFAEAAQNSDLSKTLTIRQVKEEFAADGTALGGRRGNAGVSAHHAIPQYIATKLGIPADLHDDVPALLLPNDWHFRDSNYPNAFHTILNEIIPEPRRGEPFEPIDLASAKRGLAESYVLWGQQNNYTDAQIFDIINVINNWLDGELIP